MPGNELALDLSLEGHLPFDEGRQLGFLGHVMDLDNKSLFMQVKDRIEPEWFLDPWAGKLYSAYREWFRRFSRIPQHVDELMSFEPIAALSPPEKIKVSKTEQLCRVERQKYGVDALREDLTQWMRCRIFHRSVGESARLFNGKQLNKAVRVLEQTVKDFQEAHFDGTPPVSWEHPRSLVEDQKLDYDNALTTGLPIFDRHLNPDCDGRGSLLRGDTTVLLAPTNVGKTTAMITIARHNVSKGKSVLFISLEGRQLDIMEKFWQASLRLTKAEFRRMALSGDPREQEYLKFWGAHLNRFLTYISMNKPGLTVEEVVSVVRSHQSRRRALVGKGYDLLVVDYPAILTSQDRRGDKYEYRQVMDYIYRQFVQLGLDEGVHVLVAAQTNREGSRVNRHAHEDDGRLVILEDIAEAFAITHSATNLITINRDGLAQAQGRTTFYICKSRSSETGWAIVCKSDFSKALSHLEDWSATAYRGNGSMASTIDDLLKQHTGRDIPDGYVKNRSN